MSRSVIFSALIFGSYFSRSQALTYATARTKKKPVAARKIKSSMTTYLFASGETARLAETWE
jgi:heme/copper-type cytochrome/quinol oxidase subunit 3